MTTTEEKVGITKKQSPFIRLSKYLPSIIFTLIEIFIVIVVLDNAGYTNNLNVMAALVLIYATIRTLAMTLGMVIDNLSLGLAKDITDIKERIKEDFDIEEEREKLSLAKEKVDRAHIKLVIRAVGVFIIYVIGLLTLIDA